MNEILPGLYHWTTFHERIHSEVHSYFVEGVKPACLIDPMLPAEGTDWFKSYSRPCSLPRFSEALFHIEQ